MENHKLVDKLKNETNISYEEAKIVLERSNWDILDAFIYLEENGKVQKPSVSIFYTNEYKGNYKYSDILVKVICILKLISKDNGSRQIIIEFFESNKLRRYKMF